MTETELMLISLRQCRRADLYADPRALTSTEQTRLAQMRRRREKGEPLQYILGDCDFFGLTFAVDKSVLVPRPETEILVDEALHAARNLPHRDARILDLGTGSGNIAVILAYFLPQASVTAVDISPVALAIAKANAERHGVLKRIKFVQAEMESFLSNCEKTAPVFDIVVSNPPYITTSELSNLPCDVRQEPRLALDGGEDGLDFYRAIISGSFAILRAGGKVFLEIGDNQRSNVADIFSQYPQFGPVKVYKDLAGRERVVAASII